MPPDRQPRRSDARDQPRQLLTINEVAELLRISRWSVYQLIWSGQLRTLKIGRRRPHPARGLRRPAVNQLDNEAA